MLKRRARRVCCVAHSVGFNFLGRDFYNSIAEKNPDVRSFPTKPYVGSPLAQTRIHVS